MCTLRLLVKLSKTVWQADELPGWLNVLLVKFLDLFVFAGSKTKDLSGIVSRC